MEQALQSLRDALIVTMGDVFEILGTSLRMRERVIGRAVLYGSSTCVRMAGGTWPFAVVRKTRSAKWICLSCRGGAGSCHHATAATEAARRTAQGLPGNRSDSDSAANDGDAVCEDGLGASEVPDGMTTPDDAGTRQWDPKTDEAEPRHLNRAPGVRGAAAGSSRPNGKRQVPQSMRPRHMVPPRAAQVKRDLTMRSLEDPTMVLFYTDADVCPYCRVRRDSKLLRREVLVECGEGVATGVMYIWRCGECNVVVIPAGRDRGIIFTSSSTAYSEVL